MQSCNVSVYEAHLAGAWDLPCKLSVCKRSLAMPLGNASLSRAHRVNNGMLPCKLSVCVCSTMPPSYKCMWLAAALPCYKGRGRLSACWCEQPVLVMATVLRPSSLQSQMLLW